MSFRACREISLERMTENNVISSDPDIFSGWYREQVNEMLKRTQNTEHRTLKPMSFRVIPIFFFGMVSRTG